MNSTSPSLLERYQPYRRLVEIGFWVGSYCLFAVLNSIIVMLDFERAKLDVATWQPVVWEWSSHLVGLALVPAIIAFERRFPLHLDTLRRNLPFHVLATVVYSLVHVLGMVGLRKLAYASQGGHYDFGNWPRELVYEYLKDWRTYAGVLLIVGTYDLLLLRLQGEARLLDAPDEGPAVEPIERPERFLVRKLG